MTTRQFVLGCMIAELDKIILARKAKVNLVTSTGGNKPRPLAKLPKAEKVNTRAACAKAAGVGKDQP